jgi:2-oxoglutarate ferredoxin oxidoreductase subunit beta
MDYITYDNITAPHGRATAVAAGIKRSNPDSLVFTYQGDGDFASIGLGESISTANRGDNITVIFINNGTYGMTGGQMAPTTLMGMKASTAPKGRNAEEHGYPMHMSEILNQLTAPAYLERTSCNTPGNVVKTKKAIKKAFENQLNGKGFSMVEIVTSCPTNWGLDSLESLTYLEEKMLPEFPLGVIRDK